MKQRVTYIIKDPVEGYDPANLNVEKKAITVSALKGAREQHMTFGLHELPAGLRDLLANSHELYLRWSSPRPYDALAPYVSRVSPGLHVFFSPLKDKKAPNVCLPIRMLFGSDIKCDTVEDTFTTPPILSGRFAHSASHQFYSHLRSIDGLVHYISRVICHSSHDRCKSDAAELLDADYFDADWDSISHTLVLKAFWSESPFPGGVWREKHNLPQPGEHALEVGVLSNEKPDEDEELKYSGALTQVGKDDKPSPVLFSFPSRHHPLDSSSTYSTSFISPTGLHPTLKVTLPNPGALVTPPKETCALHTYLILPSYLFIDRYPLSDALALRNHNLKTLHSLSGATDLEAPDYLTPAWGSAALFEIDTSDAAIKGSKEFDFTVPLHLRYLSPNANGSQEVSVPDPVVFWACPAEEYGKYPSSPFDRVNLGYEGLFGPKTLFYHFTPTAGSSGELVQRVQVPVLDLSKAWYVEWGTVVAVLFGALLVGFPLVKVLFKEFGERLANVQGGEQKAKAKEVKESKKKK